MVITREIFEGFLNCPYKAYRMVNGDAGHKSEYEIIQKKIYLTYKAAAIKKVFAGYKDDRSSQDFYANGLNLRGGDKIIHQRQINHHELSSNCCTLERVSGGSELGPFHYIPIIFSPKEKLIKEDKLVIAFDGSILGNLQGRKPEYGKVIYGSGFKTTKLRIGSQIDSVKKLIEKIKKAAEEAPRLILNRHCQICEFRESCKAEAIENDDLSLLAGIGEKEIEMQNKKGIFTVTQYSYTFRPRKRFKKSYPFNLKALALREKKIHVYGTPEIPEAKVRIYLDVEGDPDRDFYYLIGGVIIENGSEKQFTFWAEDQSEEKDVFLKFIGMIKDYPEFRLYHYGSYEAKVLKKMQKMVSPEYAQILAKIIESSTNVLSTVYSHIFFPTYTNGLKDIGAYLGFRWTREDASGIQSLVWRKQFEISKEETLKNRLVEYNLEDCLALKRVVEFINQIGLHIDSDKKRSDVVFTDDLKEESKYKFGRVDFVLEDLEYINNCAYFDYQREKVFVRTSKNLKRVQMRQRFEETRTHKVNKKIMLPLRRQCPQCRKRMYRYGYYSRRVFDLKFSDAGVKRWLTIYYTNRVRCPQCKKVISSTNFGNLQKYGHGMTSWIMYQNIVGHQPFYRIQHMLHDLFGFSVSRTMLQRLKSAAAEHYEATYKKILSRITKGTFIHVDETQISLQGINGYVWVFTNMEEVYFLYNPTREGGFLKELLRGFKGVLISDFYGAYCSPKWIQQKCLIHFIRDLNEDLRSSPFDNEYKEMATDFSLLLRQIIATIDKCGLKKRNLSKHKKDVSQYFRNIFRRNYQSELAQKYQKRFQKNEDTLFTFLDHDGIPWNNNNAEHAIKHFAIYRRTMKTSGNFTEPGLKQYLILLSIYQTCRYKGINFLKFLVSKEKNLERFLSENVRQSN